MLLDRGASRGLDVNASGLRLLDREALQRVITRLSYRVSINYLQPFGLAVVIIIGQI